RSKRGRVTANSSRSRRRTALSIRPLQVSSRSQRRSRALLPAGTRPEGAGSAAASDGPALTPPRRPPSPAPGPVSPPSPPGRALAGARRPGGAAGGGGQRRAGDRRTPPPAEEGDGGGHLRRPHQPPLWVVAHQLGQRRGAAAAGLRHDIVERALDHRRLGV